MTFDFKLPDIGEGLTEGEVVKWHIKEGDSVKENQPMVNVLTDKAEVQIPSPKTGRIAKLLAKEGQKVKVGEVMVTFDIGGNGAIASHPGKEKGGRDQGSDTKEQGATSAILTPTAAKSSPGTINAMPAVRKLAAELRVDLATIHGTGPGGRITEDDVRKATGAPLTHPSPQGGEGNSKTPSPGGQAGNEGEERVPFIGIRRRTAEKMSQSKKTVAHVTHMDEADLTPLVQLREELKSEAEKRNVKLTFLPFIIRALVKSLKEYPNLNATLDEAGGAIIRKKRYNIGIAAATEQGLMVPVVKDADRKDVWTLAVDVNRLAEKARANKIEISELQGGTFTITNIGPIGGLFATPIVNHPEIAILGVMKLQKRPVVREDKVVVRVMMNLALSFDHRVVDGSEAAHFMNTLIRHLENPRTLL